MTVSGTAFGASKTPVKDTSRYFWGQISQAFKPSLLAALVLAAPLSATAHADSGRDFGWPEPVAVSAVQEAPAGVVEMLTAAAEDPDPAVFEKTLQLALKAWPSAQVEIIRAADAIRPQSVSQELKIIVIEADKAVADAEAAQRARGLMYFVDPNLWNPAIEFGGTYSTGDTQEQAVSFGLTMNREFGTEWEHDLSFRTDFARRNGVTTRERYDLQVDNIWNAWQEQRDRFVSNFFQFEVDNFAGYDWRVTENIGAGFRVLDTEKMKLRIQGGPGIRITRNQADPLTLEAADTVTEFLGRIAMDYEWQINEKVKLTDSLDFSAGTEFLRFNNLFGLNAQFNSSLSAVFGFETNWESVVQPGTSKLDTVTRATLIYTF